MKGVAIELVLYDISLCYMQSTRLSLLFAICKCYQPFRSSELYNNFRKVAQKTRSLIWDKQKTVIKKYNINLFSFAN